jgi:hypothetical protein
MIKHMYTFKDMFVIYKIMLIVSNSGVTKLPRTTSVFMVTNIGVTNAQLQHLCELSRGLVNLER